VALGRRRLGCFWVRSGHSAKSGQCPLYPRKRTLLSTTRMSALCQKRTCAAPLKYLVGAAGQGQRNCNAERLGSLQVDIHLKILLAAASPISADSSVSHRPILRSQLMNGARSISSNCGQPLIGAGVNHVTGQFSGGTGASPKNSVSLCLTVGKKISRLPATGGISDQSCIESIIWAGAAGVDCKFGLS